MSRIITNDYEKLDKFTIEYKIKHATDRTFKSKLKTVHRHYLALLTIVGEILHQNIVIPTREKELIVETISSFGESIFCTINGAYKPSKAMLRSGIEVFIKHWLISENPHIDKEKLIYKIFDIADNDTIFQEKNSIALYNNLKNYYKTLCSSIHSATQNDLSLITSLNHFPHFDTFEYNATSDLTINIMSKITNLLCLKHKNNYLASHHENKAILNTVLNKEIKLHILGNTI